MLDEQHNVDPQIDEVEAEVEAKSSGLPLWVYIAGGAAVLLVVVLSICAFTGVFDGKSSSKLKKQNQGQAKRKVTGTENKPEITTESTKIDDPKKEEELDVTAKASSYSLGLNKETAAGTGLLATAYGVWYKFFSSTDETVVVDEEPTSPWCFDNENGECVPDADKEPCVPGVDAQCQGPTDQCFDMDGSDPLCQGLLNKEGLSSTEVGLWGAAAVASIAGLYYGVPFLYKKLVAWKNGSDTDNTGKEDKQESKSTKPAKTGTSGAKTSDDPPQTVGFDFDGVCHRSVYFDSTGQGHPITSIYEWGHGHPYPNDIQVRLNASSKTIQYSSGGHIFNVSRTSQTNTKTGAKRKVSPRNVTENNLEPNAFILNKIKGYLASGATVYILTHNRAFARPKGNSLIRRFLTRHIGAAASKIKIRVAKNPHPKSVHLQRLGIQVFHDDSVNVLNEIRDNYSGPKLDLYQVFPRKSGASCCQIYG